MNTSDDGISLITRFEGFRSSPYLCPAGVATIGYGSTFYASGTKVTLQDSPIDEEAAKSLLQEVLPTFERALAELIEVPLSQCQFDALIDFVYNEGSSHLASSTLLRKLNAGDYAGASAELLRWDYAGREVLQGLEVRRQAEKDLFDSGAA